MGGITVPGMTRFLQSSCGQKTVGNVISRDFPLPCTSGRSALRRPLMVSNRILPGSFYAPPVACFHSTTQRHSRPVLTRSVAPHAGATTQTICSERFVRVVLCLPQRSRHMAAHVRRRVPQCRGVCLGEYVRVSLIAI